MTPARWLLVTVIALGLATALAFHSSGALSEGDALTVTALSGGVSTSPPMPVSTRAVEFSARVVRLVWAPTGIFRAAHLGASLWLTLAALLTAILARRLAGGTALGFAAGFLAASALLFGGVTGRHGLEAGPVAPQLAMLASAALCWTGESLRPRLGGLLLGLAVADQPLALLLAPGFALLARDAADRRSGFLGRAGVGVLLGLLALFLPLADAREAGILDTGHPSTPLRALAAWMGSLTPAWRFGGPESGIAGVTAVALAAWRSLGPIGLALALGGAWVLWKGAPTSAGRAFVLAFVPAALARFFGTPSHPELLDSLLSWCLVLWTVPGLVALTRTPDDERRAPYIALATVLALVAFGVGHVDRSAEKDVRWAGTVLETLPGDALLLTSNPVQAALLPETDRGDVDLVYLPDGSSLTAYRTGQDLLPFGTVIPPGPVAEELTLEVVRAGTARRPVLIDPSLYFDSDTQAMFTAAGWTCLPHGLAFQLLPPEARPSNEQASRAVLAWEDVNVQPGTPESELRDGLTGGQYYARGILQSGVEYVERDRGFDAERDFLLALSHPDVSRTLAAHGLARVFFERGDYAEAVNTLESWVEDDDPGAWVALKMLASAYTLTRDRDRAVATLQRALSIVPPDLTAARADLQRSLDNLTRPAGN